MTEPTRNKTANWIFKLLTGFLLVFVFEAAVLIPISGLDSGLSLGATAWAAPNCDKDNDTFIKDSKSCRNKFEGPYDCDDSVYSAENDCSDGGGGDGGNDLGKAIPMHCLLEGQWGDENGDTLKGDKLGLYSDAVDKVGCDIGGPSVPWPIRLVLGGKGNPSFTVRRVDLNFDADAWEENFTDSRLLLPDYLFEEAPELGESGYPDMDQMEPIRFSVRPYRKTQTPDGVHMLDPDTMYEMGMTISIPGEENRFTISVAGQWYEGNENFTGIACQGDGVQDIIDNAPGGGFLQDVSVYLWPDADADGYPDGYTVTTGVIDNVKNPPLELPEVSAESRYAAVCSSIGPEPCGNPKSPTLCNFLGYVPMQFTLHAEAK